MKEDPGKAVIAEHKTPNLIVSILAQLKVSLQNYQNSLPQP